MRPVSATLFKIGAYAVAYLAAGIFTFFIFPWIIFPLFSPDGMHGWVLLGLVALFAASHSLRRRYPFMKWTMGLSAALFLALIGGGLMLDLSSMHIAGYDHSQEATVGTVTRLGYPWAFCSMAPGFAWAQYDLAAELKAYWFFVGVTLLLEAVFIGALFLRPKKRELLSLAVFVSILIMGFTTSAFCEGPGLEAPHQLMVEVGGFTGPSYRVEIAKDGEVIYLHNNEGSINTPGTKRTSVRVTSERWRDFRKHLDAVHIWSWKKDYNKPTPDGTSWDVQVGYADHHIASGGHNAYPPDYQFKKFLAAVRDLIGGRPFE